MFITWLFYLYNCTKLRLNKIDVSDCQVSVGYVALSCSFYMIIVVLILFSGPFLYLVDLVLLLFQCRCKQLSGTTTIQFSAVCLDCIVALLSSMLIPCLQIYSFTLGHDVGLYYFCHVCCDFVGLGMCYLKCCLDNADCVLCSQSSLDFFVS